MPNVFIDPDYSRVSRDVDNGGIRRVVDAKTKHLPKFGVNIVHRPEEADVIINNGATHTEVRGIPSIHVGHGLYWSRQPWGNGYFEVNKEVVESMRKSVVQTVPSKWVGEAVRRGGYWYPEVVYHGVDPEDFAPQNANPLGPVLWNKARADYVSDPGDMMILSKHLAHRKFVTTIGNETENVSVCGTVSYEKMRGIIASSGVYLATARETFGIGTLEAMAMGIPIAGWNWGGQSEIIIQGVTGYLAPPGDFRALAECVENCYKNHEMLREGCINDVRERWTWEPRIQQYADMINWVHQYYNVVHRPKVSVVVTTYNLDRYLNACLDSIQSQTMKDFECVVIDDAQQQSTKKLVEEYSSNDSRFVYQPTPYNFGLPGARNFGANKTSGLYVRHVDADDMLVNNALEIESKALDLDRGIDIAYGHLEVIREDGSRIMERGQPVRSGWPPEQFDWHKQMAHLNQLPSCCMMRREVLQRSGGYRERMKRNEDAEFWCRVTSLGFHAKKVTQAVTYLHREREDSKGATEWKTQGSEPDWTAWFPWRMGAKNMDEALAVFKRHGGRHPEPYLVPFGAQGKPDGVSFWHVHDYSYPVVSIIVTCGPGHKGYLLDALDSIQAQRYPDWECIVVNDTGEEWSRDIAGAPWAKVISTGANRGVSEARNMGLEFAKGKYIIWLDGDDYWMPWFLEKMVAYAEENDGVIYSDLIMQKDDKEFRVYRYDEFNGDRLAKGMLYAGSSVLYPRKVIGAVLESGGGWDVQIPGMEDWDFQMQVHALGFCAYRVPEPLFVYRTYSSTKRETDYAKIDDIRAYMVKKWGAYYKGEKVLMCGCNKKKVITTKPTSSLSSSGQFGKSDILETEAGAMVTVEYVGPLGDTFPIRSKISRDIVYRFGNNEHHKKRAVLIGDAEWMIGEVDRDNHPMWRIISSGKMSDTTNPEGFLGQNISA